MGFLVRRTQPSPTTSAPSSDLLRLPSRAELPRDVRNRVDQAMGEERGRTMVQMTRMQGLGQVGDAAIGITTFITGRAEQAAMRYPDDRGRVDAVADMVATACMRLVEEQGR